MEAGQEESDSALEDEDEIVSMNVNEPPSRTASSRRKRMQLEVVDIGSTSVSLAVFGSAEESPANANLSQPQHHNLGSSEASPVSANPPNISIKLNSAAWPHVFHSDAFLVDSDGTTQASEDTSASASSILVWGLSPGVNYQIELGVYPEQDEGM